MRRFQLFGLAKSSTPSNAVDNAEAELPSQTEVFPAAAELSKLAEECIAIAKKVIEPMIKNPAAPIVVTEDLTMALRALKNAAEMYEEIGAWNEAIFAWSMLKDVPVDSTLQHNASERINLCQRHIQGQLIPHPPRHSV